MTKELLGHLNEIVGERISKDRDWPQTERKLTNHLKVAVTFLRRVGIAIAWEEKRTRRGRPISIRAVPPPKDSPTTSSPPSSDQENGESQNESNNLDGDDSANARHHQSHTSPPYRHTLPPMPVTVEMRGGRQRHRNRHPLTH